MKRKIDLFKDLLKRTLSVAILMLTDILFVAVSLYAASILKDGKFVSDLNFLFLFILNLGMIITFNSIFNCYGNVWKFAGSSELIRVTASLITSEIVIITVIILLQEFLRKIEIDLLRFIPLLIIAGLIEYLLMISTRFLQRFIIGVSSNFKKFYSKTTKRILIFGGSENYANIIDRIMMEYDNSCKIIAVLNNKTTSAGLKIGGVDIIYGGIENLEYAINKFSIDEVVVAEAESGGKLLNRIYKICKENKCDVKLYSGIVFLTEANFLKKGSLREVKIEDLLGRNEVKLDVLGLSTFVRDKVILVTGAAGSIGSEICRQVLKYGCRYLVCFDINENGLFELEHELFKQYGQDCIVMRIGSIRDSNRLAYLFKKYSPNIVFHAAAHKHVPMMEGNPGEAIKNNVFGTYNVAINAIEHNVEKFILISTDKAVNPTNIMGASKRIAELLIKELNGTGKTELAAVRFGNVLGSNGSVIPTFKRQIDAGGPVTVTHPEIKRYFMTIPEAVQLVLQAGYIAKGGETFELDMGEPVKIYDLACEMIRLSGLEPEKDIQIEFTGLRPGEKLFEELNLMDEKVEHTENNKIFICRSEYNIQDVMGKINKLISIVDADDKNLIAQSVKDIVEEYDAITFKLIKIKQKRKKIDILKLDEEDKAIV